MYSKKKGRTGQKTGHVQKIEIHELVNGHMFKL